MIKLSLVRVLGSFLVVLVPAVLTSCGISDEGKGEPPNLVSFKLDGVPIDIPEGFSLTFLDETKDIGGPNTNLYFLAYQESTTPGELLGERLRINIPPGIAAGDWPITYTYLPGKNNIWVSYRTEQADEAWIGFEGTLTIFQLGGPGERLVAQFKSINLIDECGGVRELTDGEINVLIGGESVWPESEVDIEEIPGSLQQIESSVFVTVDGNQRVCSLADFVLQTWPANESGTGSPEDTFSTTVVCACESDNGGSTVYSESILIDLPPAGQGDLTADYPPYGIYYSFDLNNTPYDPADDEFYTNLTPVHIRYEEIGAAKGEAVDFSFTEPLELTYISMSGIDPNRTVVIESLHGFGVLMDDCRPNMCY